MIISIWTASEEGREICPLSIVTITCFGANLGKDKERKRRKVLRIMGAQNRSEHFFMRKLRGFFHKDGQIEPFILLPINTSFPTHVLCKIKRSVVAMSSRVEGAAE